MSALELMTEVLRDARSAEEKRRDPSHLERLAVCFDAIAVETADTAPSLAAQARKRAAAARTRATALRHRHNQRIPVIRDEDLAPAETAVQP